MGLFSIKRRISYLDSGHSEDESFEGFLGQPPSDLEFDSHHIAGLLVVISNGLTARGRCEIGQGKQVRGVVRQFEHVDCAIALEIKSLKEHSWNYKPGRSESKFRKGIEKLFG